MRLQQKSILAFVAALAAGACAARTVADFHAGWTFTKEGASAVSVTLPHDWAIAGPFDPALDGNTGKLPWRGRGTYETTITCAELPKGRVFLDFEGVMAHATVFANGNPCGRGDYGYLGFRADLTPYLMKGENKILVKVDTDNFKSRWYPGGGIYRPVHLVKTDDIYIEDDDLQVVTKDVLTNRAEVKVRGVVTSRRLKKAKGVARATLKDPSGAVVATAKKGFDVDGYADEDFTLKLKVPNPQLWELVDGAKLYTLEISVSGEGFADSLVRRIGLREFSFDADRGFILNGKRVQLNGVDLHSDLGPLGMAFDKDAMRRQLAIMRDMGMNALRTSHNCPAPGVLDLCDEMGIFVWDECFDKWQETCGRGDEPLEDFVSRQLARFVRRDRNHPCVFAWSIGNEISIGRVMPPGQESWANGLATGTSAERCARFRHAVRAEDDTRPVGIGSCFPKAGERGDYDALDITGWNYNGMYDKMRAHAPDKPLLYTESASALSEWGFYAEKLPTNKTDFAWAAKRVDSYDFNSARWSDIPDREFLRMTRDPFVGGEFVWTGIDYLGEPTPYNDSRSSYFGICDLCAFPKDRFYLYRAHWNRDAFTLYLVPCHWNFPEKKGKTVPVFAYTSADEAELFLNGKSLGRRRKDPNAGNLDDYYSILPRYRLMWMDVPYEPGELKVVAYGKDGKACGTQVIRTAGAAARVALAPERVYGSLCVVQVTLADAAGNFVPNDDRRVSFAAEGCEILAVGNSDPRGMDSFKDVSSHPLKFGRAGVYLRVKPGVPARLTARADGLEPATAEIRP